MRTRRSAMRLMLVAVVGMLALPVLAVAQSAPQTAWGTPDLQGVWDFRTITPLERPEELGDQAFLSAEEAANLRAQDFDFHNWGEGAARLVTNWSQDVAAVAPLAAALAQL